VSLVLVIRVLAAWLVLVHFASPPLAPLVRSFLVLLVGTLAPIAKRVPEVVAILTLAWPLVLSSSSSSRLRWSGIVIGLHPCRWPHQPFALFHRFLDNVASILRDILRR